MPNAVVTGASGGVGRAITAQLLTDGWTVYALYHHGHPSLASLDDASSTGSHHVEESAPEPQWIQLDLTSPSATQPQCGTLPQLDQLDALIHCAGYCRLASIADAPAEDWQRTFDLNVYAPAALTNHYLSALRAAHGSVVYINSGAGLHVNPGWTVYAASKHAARAWCDGLRAEEPRIRVCSIYPGRIDTPMQRSVVAQEGNDYEPDNYLSVETVATTAIAALTAPSDAHLTDIMVRPQPAEVRISPTE